MEINKVSILVSTYNWPEALELSLKSMFVQKVLPDEIVIADDGSTSKTKELIDKLRKETSITIKHVWQEDKGFRKTTILNKAIVEVTGDYILQVDGDVVLDPYFVSDHIEIAQRGCFVCGSRVKLSQEETNSILRSKKMRLRFWNMPLSFVFNSFRSKLLRHFLAFRYARRLGHLRGCNMAFWKEDLIRVNGYNEDLTQWGHEDTEIAYRLHFAGVRKKVLKMGGIVYHLYHKESSRSNEYFHNMVLEKVISEKTFICLNGINKYL